MPKIAIFCEGGNIKEIARHTTLPRTSCTLEFVLTLTKGRMGTRKKHEKLWYKWTYKTDGASGKELAYQCRRSGFNPWVRKIPWRTARQSIEVKQDWATFTFTFHRLSLFQKYFACIMLVFQIRIILKPMQMFLGWQQTTSWRMSISITFETFDKDSKTMLPRITGRSSSLWTKTLC